MTQEQQRWVFTLKVDRYTVGMSPMDWSALMAKVEAKREWAIVRDLNQAGPLRGVTAGLLGCLGACAGATTLERKPKVRCARSMLRQTGR
jgi:hypothetical protein